MAPVSAGSTRRSGGSGPGAGSGRTEGRRAPPGHVVPPTACVGQASQHPAATAVDRDRGDGDQTGGSGRAPARAQRPVPHRTDPGGRARRRSWRRSPSRRPGSPPPDRCLAGARHVRGPRGGVVPADAAVTEDGHDRADVRGHRDGPGHPPAPVARAGPTHRSRRSGSARSRPRRPPRPGPQKATWPGPDRAGAPNSASRGRAPCTVSCSLIVSPSAHSTWTRITGQGDRRPAGRRRGVPPGGSPAAARPCPRSARSRPRTP